MSNSLYLGQIVITQNAKEVLTGCDLNAALLRHQLGDWGDVYEDTAEANREAANTDGDILSVYTSANDVRFFIKTEQCIQTTTVYLPWED